MATDLTRIGDTARNEPTLVCPTRSHHQRRQRAGLRRHGSRVVVRKLAEDAPRSRMYGKSACPVLRGAGVQLGYGRDVGAPPRKQAANGEHKHLPVALGDSCLLEGLSTRPSSSTAEKKVPVPDESPRTMARTELRPDAVGRAHIRPDPTPSRALCHPLIELCASPT